MIVNKKFYRDFFFSFLTFRFFFFLCLLALPAVVYILFLIPSIEHVFVVFCSRNTTSCHQPIENDIKLMIEFMMIFHSKFTISHPIDLVALDHTFYKMPYRILSIFNIRSHPVLSII